jgi:hypothetical protein
MLLAPGRERGEQLIEGSPHRERHHRERPDIACRPAFSPHGVDRRRSWYGEVVTDEISSGGPAVFRRAQVPVR